jgi:hypothetical protein
MSVLMAYLGANKVVHSLLLEHKDVLYCPHQHLDHEVAGVIDWHQHPNHQNPAPCLKIAIEVLQAAGLVVHSSRQSDKILL